jgi:hypothetical protein
MKKIKVRVLIAFLFSFIISYFLYVNSSYYFIKKSIVKLNESKNQQSYSGTVYRKTFQDQSWILATNTSIASGGNFNLAIILDSNSNINISHYPFSGYEGLSVELSELTAVSLEDFYKLASKFEFQIWK